MSARQRKTAWPVKKYSPRHATWPYSDADFARQDIGVDSDFYSAPRFVAHIDDAAIASLKEYYDVVLPRKGRILDVCSSWISHYPYAVEIAAAKGELKIAGVGMNRAELAANKVLNSGDIIMDLNYEPDVFEVLVKEHVVGESEEEMLDASTNVVSIDYLTRPVDVLQSLRTATKVGGTVHLVISNRCFPTKAVDRWLNINEDERLLMVGDYLHFAGWKDIEIVELSDGKPPEGPTQAGLGNFLSGIIGMGGRDPLWVVRANKV
ncbi:Uu.00g050270.m01.CDS01 [Anthostomella pinea]|uniref:Uu.00g050270.m01.CDS01 n=1 Tax=Anthostomella pinea TaxID=933095 RepID=A0AAI8YMN3_9PEZI|nr:Uu.00g050270.m01.CDS01 [Anthostomella pinea]